MELVPKAEFSIVTRASFKAWIPELTASAGAEVTETYIDFFPPRSGTGTLGPLTRELAGNFLTGALLMASANNQKDEITLSEVARIRL